MLNIIQQTYGNQIDLTTDEEENCQVTGFFFYLEMTLSTRLFRIKQQIQLNWNQVKKKILKIIQVFVRKSTTNTFNNNNNHKTIPLLVHQIWFHFDRLFSFELICVEMNYLNKCPCKKHLSTQLIDRTFPISVENLFSCIFNNNEFLSAYHQSRRIQSLFRLSFVETNRIVCFVSRSNRLSSKSMENRWTNW